MNFILFGEACKFSLRLDSLYAEGCSWKQTQSVDPINLLMPSLFMVKATQYRRTVIFQPKMMPVVSLR